MAIVEQEPDRGRSGIVELSCADGPQESAEKAAGHGAAGNEQQHDHAHAAKLRRASQRMAPALMPITVSELTGIRMAAARGVRAPLNASVRPTAL